MNFIKYALIAACAFLLGVFSTRPFATPDRWQVVRVGNTPAIWKVNATTGEAYICNAYTCRAIATESSGDKSWEKTPAVKNPFDKFDSKPPVKTSPELERPEAAFPDDKPWEKDPVVTPTP